MKIKMAGLFAVLCAFWTMCAVAAEKDWFQRAQDAFKNGEYADGAKYADKAFDKGQNRFNAIDIGLQCRLKLEGEKAWEWLEKLTRKTERSNLHLAGDMMGIYGFRAYKMYRPDLAKKALQWFEKNEMKPRHYSGYWLPTIRIFDELSKFPRAETEIRFPSKPKWFGTAGGKTVHVKDLGFNENDMTAVIQKAIDDPANGTLIFDKMPTPWRISSLKLRSNLVLVFEDGVQFLADEATQINNPQNCDMFKLVNVSNVVFAGNGATPADVRIGKYENYEMRRKYAKDYGGSGFDLDGAKNIVIYNMTVADCSMDGLCVGGLKPSNNGIYVKDVVFDSNYRQACSLVNVDGIYFKNVSFTNTRGGQPMCGVDIEPSIQEVQAVAEIYLFDCKFSGNLGSHLFFSCSSAYPVTLHAKRCQFDTNRHNALVNIFALPGVYFAANVAAPSKIIFEECKFRQFGDMHAIQFDNSSFFNVDFIDSSVMEVPSTWTGREKEGAPVAFELKRTYANNDCDKPGRVMFKDLRVNGWKESPTIAIRDMTGTYSVTNLFGTITHNKKKVDVKSFRHQAPGRTLDAFAAFDPEKFLPLKKVPKAAGASIPEHIRFADEGPWYEPKPKYQAIYWDGQAWATRDIDLKSPDLKDLARKPVAYMGKPVMSWGKPPVDFSPAYQISVAVESKKESVIYFEVPAGVKECVIRLLGDAEIRTSSGRLVGEYDSAKDALNGAKFIRFKPMSKKSEVYSVRISKSVAIKFFHPLTGIIAESPDCLPRLKKNDTGSENSEFGAFFR